MPKKYDNDDNDERDNTADKDLKQKKQKAKTKKKGKSWAKTGSRDKENRNWTFSDKGWIITIW